MTPPSAVTININNKLTPPVPPAAHAPAPSAATTTPTTNPAAVSYLPIITPPNIPSIDIDAPPATIEELKAEYGETVINALIEAGISDPQAINNLMHTLEFYAGNDLDAVLVGLPNALKALTVRGFTETADIITILTMIAEDAREEAGKYIMDLELPLRKLFQQGVTDPIEMLELISLALEMNIGEQYGISDIFLVNGLLALRSLGLSDPEIRGAATYMAAAISDPEEIWAAFRNLNYAVNDLKQYGMTEPDRILELVENICLACRSNDPASLFLSLDFVIRQLTLKGIDDPEILFDLLNSIVICAGQNADVALNTLPAILAAFQHSPLDIDPGLILEIIKNALSWNDIEAIKSLDFFVAMLISHDYTEYADLIEMVSLINPAQGVNAIALIEELNDQGITDPSEINQIIRANQFLFTIPGHHIDDDTNIVLAFKALPQIRSMLAKLGLDTDQQMEFINKLLAKGRFAALANLPAAITALENADITDPGMVFDILWTMVEQADEWTGNLFASLATVLYICQERGLDITDLTSAEQEILFGIDPFRFTSESYLEIVNNRLNDLDPNDRDPRPLALMIYPEADHNTAFEKSQAIIQDLIDKGYKIMYYEVDNENDFIAGFKSATRNQLAQIVIIGGHGDQDSTALGNEDPTKTGTADAQRDETKDLDLSDLAQLQAAGLADCVVPNATIISVSCSTGRGRADGPNMANMWSQVFPGAKVYAPTIPTNIRSIKWDENEIYIAGVSWRDKDSNYTAVSEPPPTQTASQP